jgi:hypothetical protein
MQKKHNTKINYHQAKHFAWVQELWEIKRTLATPWAQISTWTNNAHSARTIQFIISRNSSLNE